MSNSEDRLYQLLPAVYRQRDAAEGMPLRDLLRVIASQVDLVEADITQLYENWFIETCQDWAVPYIADLIGYRPVHEAGEPGEVSTVEGQQRNRILIPRREVANTIRYRRRKGTLALLELLANDVAGWAARAVEFYQLLGWTQHVNHLRLKRGRTVDLRLGEALDRLNSPFNEVAHSVDIRRIHSRHEPGYYNIPSVGLFVWRLKVYSVTKTQAYCIDRKSACYTFSVLSNNTPLYTHPQPEPEPTHIADELNLPIPIRRQALQISKDSYYGIDKSLQIWTGVVRKGTTAIEQQPVLADQIVVGDLSNWQYHSDAKIVVDPALGRMLFPTSQWTQKGVWVSYHYAFSNDIGGGEYDRPIAEPVPYRLLDETDLNNPAALFNKLQQSPTDPISTYIQQHLTASTRALLSNYTHPDPPSEELLTVAIADLNQLIQRESIFEVKRFEAITLTPQTYDLINQNPQSKRLIQLNRLLLEQAYSQEVAKYSALYTVAEGGRINDALAQWRQEKPRYGVIELTHSSVYVEPIDIELPKNRNLTIRAANRTRPILRQLDWKTDQPDAVYVRGEFGSRLTLDGLLVTGRGMRVEGDLAEVTIRHCTLVPGWQIDSECNPASAIDPSLELSDVQALVTIDHSILGTIQVNQDEVKTDPIPIHISDSILDATAVELEAIGAPSAPVAHAIVTIVRSTILGQTQVHAMQLAENSIFTGEVLVARRQIGCMRFCYSPPHPGTPPRYRTPRRYNCQPDLVDQAVVAASLGEDSIHVNELRQRERDRVCPQFNSTRYGTPTYCQLSHSCADEIKGGADDESEMGVFHNLFQPQRAANLRARLDEYTPAGMETGIIYAS